MTYHLCRQSLHKAAIPSTSLYINTSSHHNKLHPSQRLLSTLYSPPDTNHINIIMSSSEIPSGNVVDNDYKSRTGQSEVPVQSDEAPIEATEYTNGGDSDAQLGMSLAN